MDIEFDRTKDEANLRKHSISLTAAEDMDLDTASVKLDTRKHYGEKRFNAIGYIGARLYVLTFTPRGKNMRVISLRRANKKERKNYEKEIEEN